MNLKEQEKRIKKYLLLLLVAVFLFGQKSIENITAFAYYDQDILGEESEFEEDVHDELVDREDELIMDIYDQDTSYDKEIETEEIEEEIEDNYEHDSDDELEAELVEDEPVEPSELLLNDARNGLIVASGQVVRIVEPAHITGTVIVQNGGTLYLESGTILGNVNVHGVFTMNNGLITGMENRAVNIIGTNAMFTMNGGIIGYNRSNLGGGAVSIAGVNASFMMNGGTISNNRSNLSGGAVSVSGINSLFIMKGGNIEHNVTILTGGGVSVSGINAIFIMEYGTISYNTALQNGGGVDVLGANATFMMNQGSIRDNVANRFGGGVSTSGINSTFLLREGNISNNSAMQGGGIAIPGLNANFLMNDGRISNNRADRNGGGIKVNGGNVNIVLENGIIGGNRAYVNGGGLAISGHNANFLIENGVIENNEASHNGGGIYFSNIQPVWLNTPTSSQLVMSGGIITGNMAGSGGGVFINETTRFTMIEGSIVNNTAAYDGGGIFTRQYEYASILGEGAYANLIIGNDAIFNGNDAREAFNPPINPEITQIRTSSSSLFEHPLNNFDINFRDQRDLSELEVTEDIPLEPEQLELDPDHEDEIVLELEQVIPKTPEFNSVKETHSEVEYGHLPQMGVRKTGFTMIGSGLSLVGTGSIFIIKNKRK
ncbi:MAG: hypothetical protein FWG67_00415 [Defluviitaleaceae bacterium]|nr:hypothetical protein [Defluviitaleaceae bacterium]